MLFAVGALLWAIVIGYVTLSRILGSVRLFGHEIDLPGWRMAIVQVVLATVDVAITASIFYALLPATPHLTWPIFLGVYVASYTAGLAANLPGGIGVFDTAILLGLEPYLSAPHIVGAIVVFRLYYYIIPLFLAGFLFTGNEILLRGGGLLRRVERLGAMQALARWSEPDFAVASATGLVALCGVMLLCVGILAPQPDFSWIDPDFAEMANQAGQFVPSLIGAGLIVAGDRPVAPGEPGLGQRPSSCWSWAPPSPRRRVSGCGSSGVLVVIAMLVAPLRSCFYRHASLLSGPLQPSSAVSLFALVICLLALAGTRPRVHLLANNAWWAVVMSHEVPNSLRLTVALAVVLALIAIWRLLRPGKVRLAALGRGGAAAAGPARRRRYRRPGPTAWSWARRSGPASRSAAAAGCCWASAIRWGRKATASRRSGGCAIWRSRRGWIPAFWRAGPGLLKVYGDLGLTALPLGPDGLPLPESPDETPEASQYLVCVAERDLKTLLPLLPQLATNQDIVPAAA